MLGISHGIVEKTENDKYRLIGVYIHKTKTNQSRSNIEFKEIILRKKKSFLNLLSSIPQRSVFHTSLWNGRHSRRKRQKVIKNGKILPTWKIKIRETDRLYCGRLPFSKFLHYIIVMDTIARWLVGRDNPVRIEIREDKKKKSAFASRIVRKLARTGSKW